MARRRMFSLDVVDTDSFLDMPASTQSLYFHLGMRADDDGFISSPRKIAQLASCALDDLKLLITKGFIIQFGSGVCVVRDWKINNYIKPDRYKPTLRVEEKLLITDSPTGEYRLKMVPENPLLSMDNGPCLQNGARADTRCLQNGSKMEPQVRLGKDRVGEDNISWGDELPPAADKPLGKSKHFVPPTLEEVTQYVRERNSKVDPQGFIDFYESKGWKVGKTTMKDWKAACRRAENWDCWAKALPSINDPKRYQCNRKDSL